MNDATTLQAGDEVRCPRCNEWHPIFVKYPDERAFQGRMDVYFNCPKAITSFRAGRVGDPVRDHGRWRRPIQITGAKPRPA